MSQSDDIVKKLAEAFGLTPQPRPQATRFNVTVDLQARTLDLNFKDDSGNPVVRFTLNPNNVRILVDQLTNALEALS